MEEDIGPSHGQNGLQQPTRTLCNPLSVGKAASLTNDANELNFEPYCYILWDKNHSNPIAYAWSW